MSNRNSPIGFFDSGIGGLKILSSVKKMLPNENFYYVFDRSHAPYGNKSSAYILKRACKISEFLINIGCKRIVIGCNTATCVSIETLKKRYGDIFIGVVPPVKKALRSTTKKVLVLCTPLTSIQSSFVNLFIDDENKNRVIVLPCNNLASTIEKNIADLSCISPYLVSLLSPYFNQNIEAIILGCTHYYFISGLISQIFPNPITIYNSYDEVNTQLYNSLKNENLLSSSNKGIVKYFYK